MPEVISKIVTAIEQRFTRRKKNLGWLSFSITFRQLASNLSIFYLPLFIYQQAQQYSFGDFSLNAIQKGMIFIAAFYFCERMMVAILALAQAKFTLKVGHEWSMILGVLLYALFLLTLTHASNSPWWLLLGAILAGIQLVFFWPSYNTLVSRLSFKKEMGRSLGALGFLQNFASMLAPAIGGLVIILFGYNLLFYSGIALLLISLIGLFQLTLAQEKDEVNIQEYLSWMKEKSFFKLAVSQSGRYFYDMSIILWPLYVFLILGDVRKVGFVYSLSLFFAMLVNLIFGHFLDKKQKSKRPYYVSGGFLSTLSVMRLLVLNVWGVVMVDAFSRVIGNFHWLFNDKLVFSRGKGSQEFSFFVYNAFNRSVSAAVFWFIMLVFFLLVPLEWTGLFLLGAVGVLLSLLAQEQRN